jgi:hypothetical protein
VIIAQRKMIRIEHLKFHYVGNNLLPHTVKELIKKTLPLR